MAPAPKMQKMGETKDNPQAASSHCPAAGFTAIPTLGLLRAGKPVSTAASQIHLSC